MKVNFFKQFFIFFITVALAGCEFDGIIFKSNEIRDIAFENCQCADVRFLSYSNAEFREYLKLEIIGNTELQNIEIAQIINLTLKNNIKGYCEIDKVDLTFINNGIKKSFIFRYCKLDN